MPKTYPTVDVYLETLEPTKRAALEKIRKAAKAAAPGAEDCFGYGVPALRLHGKLIAGYSAGKTHCSYYPMSGDVVTKLKADLKQYDAANGTVRFAPEKPLPATLVRKLVKARLDELER